MLRSMTAYGRKVVTMPVGRFVVEIQSINRRHLDVNPVLPSELLRFDPDVRKWVSEAVSRGKVTVYVRANFDQTPVVVSVNKPLAKQVKTVCEDLEKDLNFGRGISLDTLIKTPGILVFDEDLKNEELYRGALCEAITGALEEVIGMKEAEGKSLQEDILKRLATLERDIEIIQAKAPGATERYRKRLQERVEEALEGTEDERILREVAIFAEKVDIAEEITRFHSHLKQFQELISSDKTSIGKTLEFLVQEMTRETNTIGSKSSDVTVARLVVDMKSEIERIREQIQNVE